MCSGGQQLVIGDVTNTPFVKSDSRGDLSAKAKGLFGSPRIIAAARLPYFQGVRQQTLSQEIGESTMNRMIRISAIVIATAVAASNLTSPAAAQAFSSSWGTGNVEETHYDAGGRLVRDAVSPNLTASQDRGLSAFASSPRKIHRK